MMKFSIYRVETEVVSMISGMSQKKLSWMLQQVLHREFFKGP